MRALMNVLPYQFNPWAFAKNRQSLTGYLLVEETTEVKNLTLNDEKIHYVLNGSLDENLSPHLSGEIQVTLNLQCQRCLEPLKHEIVHEFDYVLIRHENEEDKHENQYETLINAEDYLDIKWFLEEEILLVTPIVAKHEKCSLPTFVKSAPSVDQAETNNPFAALKDLISNKEKP